MAKDEARPLFTGSLAPRINLMYPTKISHHILETYRLIQSYLFSNPKVCIVLIKKKKKTNSS